MSIRKGDAGKVFRLSTEFDMSSSTSLTLNFVKPDGTTLQKTNPTVTAPAVQITDPDLGLLNASEYMAFTTVAADFDQTGVWTVCGVYADTVASEILSSAEATFTVLDGCS